MRAAAAGLAALGVRPGILLTSPLARARQTARIVAAALDPRPSIEEEGALEPDRSPSDTLGVLSSLTAKEVVLVGHAPHLDRLASLLTTSSASGVNLTLRKGGAARIDFDGAPGPGRGELVLVLTPRVLRRIGMPPSPPG